jgi:hypothetical protein
MSAKGYTSALLVVRELGEDLTAPQLDQAADLIAAAESVVDRETGRAWIASSPTTDELHVVGGPFVYLKHRPVTAVTSVKVRRGYVGSADVTLTPGTDYELMSPERGLLNIAYGYPGDVVRNDSSGYGGYLLKVTYTHATPVDPEIQKITTELVAAWMRNRMGGADTAGLKSYRLPDLSVEYQDDASSGDEVPADLLRRMRAFDRVLFA